jgi:transcriptional regulator with XRE-family HTH domain
VEQFEQIRRDREREGLSLRALAERHGVHRRTVRAALLSPLPPARRVAVSRPAPKLGRYRELIDAWLIADVDAPRKQCWSRPFVCQGRFKKLTTWRGCAQSPRIAGRNVRWRREHGVHAPELLVV